MKSRAFQSSYEVPACATPLQATITVPGSKSITNRALPMAALANGRTRLRGALFSDDSRYFIQSLQRLGYRVEIDEMAKEVIVYGAGIEPLQHVQGLDLFVGNSGTSARFLSAFVSLGKGSYRIDGVSRMRERPIAALIAALRELDVDVVDELGTGCPPILIEAQGLRGGTVLMSGKDSSQFVSGLLIAAPYAKDEVTLIVQGELVSAPYVTMTLAMMRQFGATVNQEGNVFHVVPSHYVAKDYMIEPDASGASYFLAAAAICGGTVTILGLGRDSLQGDAQFAQVLANMGCTVRYGFDRIELSGPPEGLRGIDVDLFAMSDMVPTLAAIAPLAREKVRIRNVANIRLKETDRIRACVTELRRFGVTVTEFDDGLEIEPCDQLQEGVTVQTYDDHRMAMAFSILGLRVPGTRIENPACTAKTYPEFFQHLEETIRGGA
ncbi:3-phosphoshikimate 1-carboxyvinyltransferase [Sulfoacidibacillus thermotolerans]|uniref:3-phosphoshikimate 1-carboxyvinyltransferase n=1 Tax=Sulfoacidibacillus thermotolerans TaxID=1765684 RepID=A0A2U3D8M0_SULT2|nr:3-phosphoshikimate 1-carboxyvinyltransferase [Sulfoacidibacillus thermotolerans]PWI57623.1 3-phosphoshikimate 1-carboxyvinyltransferase [Sulfoacidibacillus thermotolerans]